MHTLIKRFLNFYDRAHEIINEMAKDTSIETFGLKCGTEKGKHKSKNARTAGIYIYSYL